MKSVKTEYCQYESRHQRRTQKSWKTVKGERSCCL